MSEIPSTSITSGNRAAVGPRGDSLADVLERVLDKGIVIAGDIRVELLDIELLTIRIRLLVSSADQAAELGLAWWRSDPFFTGEDLPASGGREAGDEATAALTRLADNTDELLRRVAVLEARDDGTHTARSDVDAHEEG